MVSIHVLNVTSKIYGLNNIQESALDSALSYWSDGFIFSPKYQAGMWDGRIHCFKKSTVANPFGKVPTGLLSRVLDILGQSNVQVHIDDQRIRPPTQTPLELKEFVLHDYEEEIVRTALEKERGLFRAATGAGKSVCLSAVTARLNVPTLVVTHRTDILVHLKSILERSLGVEVGHLQGKNLQLKKFNVAMIQTLKSCFNREDSDRNAKKVVGWIKNDCQCLQADEIHHGMAKTYQQLFNRAYQSYYRMGWSATINFGKSTDIAVESGFGKVQVSVTPSDLIRKKRLSKPYIFFVDYGDTSTDEAVVEKCNDCGSAKLKEVLRRVNRVKKISSSDEEDVLDLARKSYICGQCGKEWTVYSSAVARCLVENEKRNNAIVRLVAERMRKKMSVLVLVNFIEHGKIIHEKLSKVVDPSLIEFAWSGTEDRKGLLQELKEKKKLCVISTAIFGEGVDIPQLSCVVLARGSASDIDTIQSIGRALRRAPGKWKTVILDFNDKSKFFVKRSKFRKKLLRFEPEFVVKDYTLK